MKNKFIPLVFALLALALIAGCAGEDLSGTYKGEIDGVIFVLDVTKSSDGYSFSLAPEGMEDQAYTFDKKAESSKVYSHSIEGDAFVMKFGTDAVIFEIPDFDNQEFELKKQ